MSGLNRYVELLLSTVKSTILDNMALANQNARLIGPAQGFIVFPLALKRKPWERGWSFPTDE
jgi:hypothetical protein